MKTYPEHNLFPDIVGVSGAAGVGVVSYPVPVGEQWEFIWVIGRHDDPAARTCYFSLFDGVDTVELIARVAVATDVRLPLFGSQWFRGNLVLTSNMVLNFYAVGLAAGQICRSEALVYKLRGLPVVE